MRKDAELALKVRKKMNKWGKEKRPFLFIIDFCLHQPVILPLPLSDSSILFEIKGVKNTSSSPPIKEDWIFSPLSPDKKRYKKAFEKVQAEIKKGNSYLINLAQTCPVHSDLSLLQIFHVAQAPYKLYFKDQFVVFSPETFVKIEQGQISTFPMKGTIEASVPDAKNKLLNDKKERAEHMTMVDLMRNDLSRFSKDVRVKQLCYLDLIQKNNGNLWQMSSEISGRLPADYPEKIGDILFSMLPAGSISGAPKKETVEIIQQTEKDSRGFYTGVFGYFDGQKMDSGVMIRFVEKSDNRLYYKSGGGITAQSKLESEYQELIQKIYVPIH